MPTYLKSVSCGFLRTRDEWGEFSNFRRLDTPIHAGPHQLATSEHLYQACKYASRPDIQERIAAAPRPSDAARLGRNPEPGPDPGWNDQRVNVMRWVIRMKREANPGSIDAALERTAQRPIVEISRHDAFWGARDAGDVYEGENVLGRLWMELRHHIRQNDPLALAEAWSPEIDVGALAPAATRQAPEATDLSPVYAGIGARQTPAPVLEQMTELASWLADRGWHLHSGGAAGADTAFAAGALQHERTLFLPWSSFNNHSGPDCHVFAPDVTARHMAIAASLHPAWDRCDATARQFHARNVGILLGPQGEIPVDAVVCWTPNGETVGGTGMAIRIAKVHDIPVLNLATDTPQAVREALERIHASRSQQTQTTQTPRGSQPRQSQHGASQPDPDQEQESTVMADPETHPAVYRDEAGRLRLRVGTDDPEAAEREFQAELRAESAPVEPALQARITEISDRFRGFLPEPGERDELEVRLGKVISRFFELARTHPRILEGLDHLSGMRDVMRPEGFVNEPFLEKLERVAANPELALQQLSASSEIAETENVSMTGMIAEQAALYGATPGPGEPDTRELWFLSPDELLKEGQSATGIAPRLFQSLAEAIELITETVTPDGYQMASEREPLLYGFVNIFHFQIKRIERAMAALEEDIRKTQGSYADTIEKKGRDVASEELERKTLRYLSLAGMRDIYEIIRDFSGSAYLEKCGKPWQPATGSHVSQTSSIASRIDSRDHRRSEAALGNRKDLPEGTRIAVTGYKHGPDYTTIFATLDAVHAKYPDMILLHGGARGVQQICAKWAENKDVPQRAFYPEYRHKNDRGAIPRRDREMLSANPTGIIAFAGPDYKPTFLHKEAIKLGMQPWVVSGAESQRQVPSQAIVTETPRDRRSTPDPELRADQHAEALLKPRAGPLPDQASELLRDRFLSFVDAIAPEHETDPRQRQDIMSRVIQAVHDHTAKPGGLQDQAQALADKVHELTPAQGPSEIVDMQLAEAVDSSYRTTGALDRAEQIRAGLADVYKDEHGEQWRPPASFAPKPDATTTAASAEASRAMQDRRDRHDLAHRIEGTPIAIAGTKDDNVPRETVFAVLDAFHKEIPDMYLVHGNAPGTQQIANEWATARDRPQLTFYPDTRNESLSRAILLRDKQIIDHSPLTVIDFSPPDKRTSLASMADKKGLNVQLAAELLHGAKQTLAEGSTVAAERKAQEQEQGGRMSM